MTVSQQQSRSLPRKGEVWYVSYGSNMCAARLTCYLEGGCPPGGRHHVGPGHYETLVEVGQIGGAPMLTFTAPHGIDHVEHNEPSAAYLTMLAAGLREGHGWDDADVQGYLDGVVPGRRASADGRLRPSSR